jgi:hypothetical protein
VSPLHRFLGGLHRVRLLLQERHVEEECIGPVLTDNPLDELGMLQALRRPLEGDLIELGVQRELAVRRPREELLRRLAPQGERHQQRPVGVLRRACIANHAKQLKDRHYVTHFWLLPGPIKG